jgi:cell division septation protein DedD
MLKYLFILINTISLFFYSLFSGDGGITISNTIPTEMPPGHEVKVNITVSKGSMSGFAKLQLEIPAGLAVREADSKGATFSINEGLVKWVWASLPSDNDLVLSLILISEPDASGKLLVTGKYSYVDNNAKQVVEMPPVEITVSKDAVVKNDNNQTTTANNESKTETTETPSTDSNREPEGNISVQRKITKGGMEGEYVVMLKVQKGLTKGFARYSDDLPEGIGAEAGKTEGASFSIADGKVKFVWVAVPEKEELNLSYTISGIKNSVDLNGEYSYLEQNQSKKFLLQKETITPERSADVVNNEKTEGNSDNKNSDKTENTSDNSNDNTAQASEKKPTNTQPTETLPKKEGSVNFMVQIGAFTNSKVTTSQLSKKFNIAEKINSEMHGGYSKFMIGSHNEYKNARDHREKIRSGNGVKSAFVVAYSGPKRITVQEALMISNQKWFR